MVQDLHKTNCSSRTTSFKSSELFTHWPPANTVRSLPQNGHFGQNIRDKISKGRPGADFYERHSFRWKWFRTYIRPFLVQKQQVLGHMKYSPIDLQQIPWQFCLKTVILVRIFDEKSRKGEEAWFFIRDILLGENGSAYHWDQF